MIVLLGPAGSGKTEELLALVVETNGLLVVHSTIARDRLIREHGEGLAGKIATIHDLMRSGDPPERPIYIDDVDLVLRSLLPWIELGGFSCRVADLSKLKFGY